MDWDDDDQQSKLDCYLSGKEKNDEDSSNDPDFLAEDSSLKIHCSLEASTSAPPSCIINSDEDIFQLFNESEFEDFKFDNIAPTEKRYYLHQSAKRNFEIELLSDLNGYDSESIANKIASSVQKFKMNELMESESGNELATISTIESNNNPQMIEIAEMEDFNLSQSHSGQNIIVIDQGVVVAFNETLDSEKNGDGLEPEMKTRERDLSEDISRNELENKINTQFSDEDMLKGLKFKKCYIPLEKIEWAHEKDRKEQLRKKLKEKQTVRDRDKKELKRKNRDRSDSRERKRRDKKSSNRYDSPSTSRSSSVAIHHSQKSLVSRSLPCCVCKNVINPDTFGRESNFCSTRCIERKVEMTKKCVKNGEQIMVMDMKGMLVSNGPRTPTIETLLDFLLNNPNFQPVVNTIAHEKIAKKEKEFDPAMLKKMESQRMEVKKTIEAALQKRSKSENMNFSYTRYKNLGLEIERELFALHCEVNQKYKEWFKDFIKMVNDIKNGYFREILRDKVSVKRLVTLTSELMNIPIEPPKPILPVVPQVSATIAPIHSASDTNFRQGSSSLVMDPLDLQGSVENEFNTDANMVIQNSGTESRHRKDMEISVTAIAAKTISTSSRHSMVMKQPMSKAQGKTTVDDILGDPDKNTTSQHFSHLYDVNCNICKKKTKDEFAQKERKERMEAKMEFKMKSDDDKKKPCFPNLDSETLSAMERNMPNPGFNEANAIHPFNRNNYEDDGFDGGMSVDVENDAYYLDDPWKRPNHVVWYGTFEWGKTFKFPCSLVALSNPDAFKVGTELPTIIKLNGMVNPRLACEYFMNLKSDGQKQVSLFMMDPPTIRDKYLEFEECYKKLLSKERYGGLKFENHPTLVEGYIFPLGPFERIPDEFLPLDGPGLSEQAESQCNLIFAIVRTTDSVEEPMAVVQNQTKLDDQVKKEESWRIPKEEVNDGTDQLGSERDSRPLQSTQQKQMMDANKNNFDTLGFGTPGDGDQLLDPRPPSRHSDGNGPQTSMPTSSSHDMENYLDAFPRQRDHSQSACSTAETSSKERSTPALPPPVLEVPHVNSVSEVLDTIARMEKPAFIVMMVAQFLSTHQVAVNDRETISRAIMEKSEMERNRSRGQGPIPPISPALPPEPLMGGRQSRCSSGASEIGLTIDEKYSSQESLPPRRNLSRQSRPQSRAMSPPRSNQPLDESQQHSESPPIIRNNSAHPSAENEGEYSDSTEDTTRAQQSPGSAGEQTTNGSPFNISFDAAENGQSRLDSSPFFRHPQNPTQSAPAPSLDSLEQIAAKMSENVVNIPSPPKKRKSRSGSRSIVKHATKKSMPLPKRSETPPTPPPPEEMPQPPPPPPQPSTDLQPPPPPPPISHPSMMHAMPTWMMPSMLLPLRPPPPVPCPMPIMQAPPRPFIPMAPPPPPPAMPIQSRPSIVDNGVPKDSRESKIADRMETSSDQELDDAALLPPPPPPPVEFVQKYVENEEDQMDEEQEMDEEMMDREDDQEPTTSAPFHQQRPKTDSLDQPRGRMPPQSLQQSILSTSPLFRPHESFSGGESAPSWRTRTREEQFSSTHPGERRQRHFDRETRDGEGRFEETLASRLSANRGVRSKSPVHHDTEFNGNFGNIWDHRDRSPRERKPFTPPNSNLQFDRNGERWRRESEGPGDGAGFRDVIPSDGRGFQPPAPVTETSWKTHLRDGDDGDFRSPNILPMEAKWAGNHQTQQHPLTTFHSSSSPEFRGGESKAFIRPSTPKPPQRLLPPNFSPLSDVAIRAMSNYGVSAYRPPPQRSHRSPFPEHQLSNFGGPRMPSPFPETSYKGRLLGRPDYPPADTFQPNRNEPQASWRGGWR